MWKLLSSSLKLKDKGFLWKYLTGAKEPNPSPSSVIKLEMSRENGTSHSKSTSHEKITLPPAKKENNHTQGLSSLLNVLSSFKPNSVSSGISSAMHTASSSHTPAVSSPQGKKNKKK